MPRQHEQQTDREPDEADRQHHRTDDPTGPGGPAALDALGPRRFPAQGDDTERPEGVDAEGVDQQLDDIEGFHGFHKDTSRNAADGRRRGEWSKKPPNGRRRAVEREDFNSGPGLRSLSL